MYTLRKHLESRRLFPEHYRCYLDEGSNIATFYIFNLSGQWIGYQTYNPHMPKYRTNLTPQEQRYYTYITGKKDLRMNAVWGLERYDYRKELLFVTEGIFDACVFHNLGYNAVACLANAPKKLKSMFKAMNHKVIGIADGDEAGKEICVISDDLLIMPDGKDANDLTDKELVDILIKNNLYYN
jgi:hypothetical protein